MFHRLNVIRCIYHRCVSAGKIFHAARHFLQIAARELGVEAKQLHPETETALTRGVAGNVRQLENTCRWLTVMAAGGGADAGSAERTV